MAYLKDILVDGQDASSSPPMLATLHPVVSWDYIEDVASQGQLTYEIRVGTSSDGLGTSHFIGNVLDESVHSTSCVYEHSPHSLERGRTYYGQVRGIDIDTRNTVWLGFSFTVNHLPVISDQEIWPERPTIFDGLDLIYAFYDADGHEESGTKTRWFKNNLHVPGYDDYLTVPSTALQVGDAWYARIIPGDGIENGDIAETSAVTVVASAQSAGTCTVYPTSPNVDDILRVTYSFETSSEVDAYDGPSAITGEMSGTPFIQWLKNGTAISGSDQTYIRPDLDVGDTIQSVVQLLRNGYAIAEARSEIKTVVDVQWKIHNLLINGEETAPDLIDVTPVLSWKVSKTTAMYRSRPAYYRILITKTASLDGPVHDTGVIQYTKDSYPVPSGVLQPGQTYFVHVAANDTSTIDEDDYLSQKITLSGSSWSDSVNNATGWTVECRLSVAHDETEDDSTHPYNMGLRIHDGTYFCTVTFYLRSVAFMSDSPVTYTYPTAEPDLRTPKTFKIAARGQNVQIYMNNHLIISATGMLDSPSSLKYLEYGDIDAKQHTSNNYGNFSFFRFSTDGAYGLESSLPDENTFYFAEIGELSDGEINHALADTVAWTPHLVSESTKLMQFNESAPLHRLQTVAKNYSPITAIAIDADRNKYIATANGVNIVYGERHDPDFWIQTTGDVSALGPDRLDKVSSVDQSLWSLVEYQTRSTWYTLDTTVDLRGPYAGSAAEDPYGEPYLASQNIIHYYSQRAHGHEWFDHVDNERGWQVSMSLDIDSISVENEVQANTDRQGFTLYVNDGTRQEIIYFHDDRVELLYAGVYATVNNKLAREYAVSGRGDNLLIYQRLAGSTTAYQLLLDGSGRFVTPATKRGDSTRPRVTMDASGSYHATWQDDGAVLSRIYYSTHNGSSWSLPEIVAESAKFNLRHPNIDIDATNRVWVIYEDRSWGTTEISVSVRDHAGWNNKLRITNSPSRKGRPVIQVDPYGNVHALWEDNRNGHWEIFWAQWDSTKQAWISSAQFGQDEPVIWHAVDDPYASSGSSEHRNPRCAILGTRLWVVAESRNNDNHTSSIEMCFRDTENGYWNASDVASFQSGSFIGYGQSTIVSGTGRNCLNPDIATSENSNRIVVVWEDQTESDTQIWGSSYNRLGQERQAAQAVTSDESDSINPSAGFAVGSCIIAYERDGHIYLSSYSSITDTFYGSAQGSGTPDEHVSLGSKRGAHPCVPPYVAGTDFSDGSFLLLYDFLQTASGVTQNDEILPYRKIGDATIAYSQADSSMVPVATTLDDNDVSRADTKEIAFGDTSESIRMLVHWKDFSLYFGYNAKPYHIVPLNSTYVTGWPSDRTYDVFVDVFGNIAAATHGGLVYYNIGTSTLTTDVIGDGGETATAITWAKDGKWYAGTTSGAWYSADAGATWTKLTDTGTKDITAIAAFQDGSVAIGTIDDGFFLYSGTTNVAQVSSDLPSKRVQCLATDADGVLWVGTDAGLCRYKDTDLLTFTRNNGLSTSHITSIAVVDRYLRFVGTAAGIDRMHGTRFEHLHPQTHPNLYNNVASLRWSSDSNSLWVGAFDTLHELTFRDEAHEIVENETELYNSTDLVTEEAFDRNIYYLLDTEPLVDEGTTLSLQSATVFINKNKITFGYVIDSVGQAIAFDCDLLARDVVEIEVSGQFSQLHNFNQTSIEEDVLGTKRTVIEKMGLTSQNQLLLLSGAGRPEVLLDAGSVSLPFTTIMLDLDAPQGCIQWLDDLSRTKIRFRILAFDGLSGVESYMLSNYENWTSDGTDALPWQPISTIVTHDLGNSINNITDSLAFPTTVTIDSVVYTVGTGSAVESWFDGSSTDYLYVGTSSPAIMWRYDPGADQWTAMGILDTVDLTRQIHEIKNVDGVLFVATGSDTAGSTGGIYKSIDGSIFTLVTSVTGDHVRGITVASDGAVYFGSSDGRIYQHKDSVSSRAYSNIGASVYSLAMHENTLIAGTGSQGRIYIIDTETDDSLIIFDGSETHVGSVHVSDDAASASSDINLYAGSGQHTVIYRASVENFDFVKSYSGYSQTVRRLRDVKKSTLAYRTEGGSSSEEGVAAVAAIGPSLFKKVSNSWEFVYEHDEEIRDFVEYEPSSGDAGMWVVSDTKVTKWTNLLQSKSVYLRLRDKAGNISVPADTAGACPDSQKTCCDVYSVNIQDLKDFVHESRIIDIDSSGDVTYTYDSVLDKTFFAANQIDQEIGVYTSEILNGSNSMVSWKSITWSATEPNGTAVNVQVRYATNEDDVSDQDWSDNLTKDAYGLVSLEHVTAQYLQFRIILTSEKRGASPSLTAVIVRNITSHASHFFTTNFVMPSRPVKGILQANTYIPVSSDIVFGVSTKDSVDFADYQIVEIGRLFNIQDAEFGNNLRVGAKLLSPSIPQLLPSSDPYDPYDTRSYICTIDFDHTNNSGGQKWYHFRIKFFNDPTRTQLGHTFFTGNDQTGWSVASSGSNTFPAIGVGMNDGVTRAVSLEPLDSVESNQRWYITVEAYDGSTWETIIDDRSYICEECNILSRSGIIAEYFQTGLPVLTTMPELRLYTPDHTLVEDNVNFGLSTTAWTTTRGQVLAGFEDNFAVRLRGKLSVPTAGEYTFRVRAKDGCKLFVDDTEIVDHDGIHDFTTSDASLSLDQTLHSIEIQYFAGSAEWGLELYWLKPGDTLYEIIPDQQFTYLDTTEYCEQVSLPRIMEFIAMFELEDAQTTKINLPPT